MCGSDTGVMWRLLTQNPVPFVACLASGVYSWRFLVVVNRLVAPKFWCSGRFVASSIVKTASSDSDVLSLRQNPSVTLRTVREPVIVIRSTAIRRHRDENCGIERNLVGGSGE